MKLRWTRRARRDLAGIARYIERDKPAAARRWVARLRQRARAAAELPESGRRVPETARNDVREVFVRSFRIVYLVDAETVWILSVGASVASSGCHRRSRNRVSHTLHMADESV